MIVCPTCNGVPVADPRMACPLCGVPAAAPEF